MRLSGVAREAIKARDNGAVVLHYDVVCELIAAYSTEQLRQCCIHRHLLLANGETVYCATSRSTISLSPQYIFEEAHFHEALKQDRSKDLLAIATLDLLKQDQGLSARHRFSLKQRYWLILVGATVAIFMFSFSLTNLIAMLSLLFSLFFFTLVMLRALCLIAPEQ